MGIKKRSAVWNFFTKLGDGWAWCSICKKQLSYKGTLTNLKAHLQRKHLNEYSQLVVDTSISDSDNKEEISQNPPSASDVPLNVSSVEEVSGRVATEVEVVGSTINESSSRPRSTAWNFFTESENGRAVCCLCNKSISYKSTVANLRAHLHRKHISVYNQLQYLQDISNGINIQEGITDISTSSIFPNSSDTLYNVSSVEEVVAEDGETTFALNVASVEEVVEAGNSVSLAPLTSLSETPGEVQTQTFIRRPRSDVWNVFHKISNDMAQCSICYKNISFKTTVSNLKAHLQRKHISEATEVQFLEDGSTNLQNQDGTSDPSTSGLLLIVSSALPTISYTAEHRLSGRQRSEIWKFFSKLGDAKAQCNNCNQIVSYRSTIFNLSSHLQRKHNSLYVELQALREKSKNAQVKEVNADAKDVDPSESMNPEEFLSISHQQSYVWNFFSNLGDGKAQCNLCHKKKLFKSSLANLRAHLQRKHNAIYSQIQLKLEDGTSFSNEEAVLDDPTSSTCEETQADSTVLSNETALATATAIAMKRQKNDLWNFFNKLDNGKAECTFCKTIIVYKSTIANLRVHLKRKHISAYNTLQIHQEACSTSNSEWQITDDHTYSTSGGAANVSNASSGISPADRSLVMTKKLVSRMQRTFFRLRSGVWKFFNKINDTRALCSVCNKKISFKSTTSNLIIHLKRKHISAYKQLLHLRGLSNGPYIEEGIVEDPPPSTSDIVMDASSEPPNTPPKENQVLEPNIEMEVTDNINATDQLPNAFSTPVKPLSFPLGRRRSVIWNIFNKSGEGWAVCSVCNKAISFKSTASNLAAHVRRKHPSVYEKLISEQEKRDELYNLEIIANSKSSAFSSSEILMDNSYAEEVVIGPNSPSNSEGSQMLSTSFSSNPNSRAEYNANWKKCFYCSDVNVWTFFKKLDDEKAQCTICYLKLSYKTTIANIKSHLKRKHPHVYSHPLEGDDHDRTPCIRCQRNNVWKFFKKIDEGKAECVLCNRILSMRTTITNLTYHLKRLHILVYRQLPYLNDINDINKDVTDTKNILTVAVSPITAGTEDSPTKQNVPEETEADSSPNDSRDAVISSDTALEPISGQMISVPPNSASTPELKMGNSRQKSDVWKFFNRLDDDEARCTICNKTLSFKSSLCNLRNHLKRKHVYVYKHLPFLKGNRCNLNVQDGNRDDTLAILADYLALTVEQQTQQTLNRHQRAQVWKYFEKLDDLDAECRKCNKIISFKLSLTSLRNHLKLDHVSLYKEFLSLIDNTTSLNLQEKTANNTTSATALSSSDEELSKDASNQRSDVWKLFKRSDHTDAQCSICNKIISFKTTMSNLRVHLKRKHISAYSNLKFLPEKSSNSSIQETTVDNVSASSDRSLTSSFVVEQHIEENSQANAEAGPSSSSGLMSSDSIAGPTPLTSEQPSKEIILDENDKYQSILSNDSPPSSSTLPSVGFPKIIQIKSEYLDDSASGVLQFVPTASPSYPVGEKPSEEDIKMNIDDAPRINSVSVQQTRYSKGGFRQQSDVWKFFTKLDHVDAQCTACNQIVSYKSTISNLRSHLQRKHISIYRPLHFTKDNSSGTEENKNDPHPASSIICSVPENNPTTLPSVSSTSLTNSSSQKRRVKEFQLISPEQNDVWDFFTKSDNGNGQCNICDKLISFKPINNLRAHLKKKHNSAYQKHLLPEGTVKKSKIQEVETDPLALTSPAVLTEEQLIEHQKDIWNFFEKVNDSHAQCMSCGKTISYILTLTNLRSHLKRAHGSIAVQPELVKVKSEKTIADKSTRSSSRPSLPTSTIVIPSSLAKTANPRNKHQNVKSKKKSPQKKTVVYRTLPIGGDLKPVSMGLKDLLHEEADSICITTDLWTSLMTNDSFIAITGHYITKEFELKNSLLQCLTLSGEHPERNISFEIRSVLTEWNLHEKVNFAIVDSALNVNDAFHDVQFEKCYTQKLNAIVKRSLEGMKCIMDKVEKIVAHYRTCTFARKQLIKFQEKDGVLKPKNLEDDTSLQWNISSMLCRFVKLEDAIKATCNTLFNKLPVLTEEDWQILRHLSEILAPLEESTNGQKYMAGGSVIVVTRCLVETFTRLQRNPAYSQEIKTVVLSIADALKEELKTIENSWTFALCTLLDPRYKHHVFLDQAAVENAKKQLECLVVACVDYRANDSQSETSDFSSANTSVWNIFNELMADKVSQTNPISKASKEVDRFFKDSILPRLNENREANCPLVWWKKNRYIYPNLAEIYRKKCNIVATLASCKKLFKKQAVDLCH